MFKFVNKLLTALEKHDCGESANMYFCVDENGTVLADVGVDGFEECIDTNQYYASRAFAKACRRAGGTVKGGCIHS